MEKIVFVCDVCAAVKGEANHWWKVLRVPGPRITVLPIDLPKRDEQAAEFHLCGYDCVDRKVNELMNEHIAFMNTMREKTDAAAGD